MRLKTRVYGITFIDVIVYACIELISMIEA